MRASENDMDRFLASKDKNFLSVESCFWWNDGKRYWIKMENIYKYIQWKIYSKEYLYTIGKSSFIFTRKKRNSIPKSPICHFSQNIVRFRKSKDISNIYLNLQSLISLTDWTVFTWLAQTMLIIYLYILSSRVQ